MPSKVITPEDSTLLRLLLYGDPGSGKTRTAATAAWDKRTAPVLHFDIGGNTLSTADYKLRPHYILLDGWHDIGPWYNWLAAGQPESSPVVKQFGLTPPYKCVILDGITEIQRGIMAQSLNQLNLGITELPRAMEHTHFGITWRTMSNFVYKFYHLPVHVIITCLQQTKQDNAGVTKFIPLIQGKAYGEVVGYAYSVGHMENAEGLQPSAKQAFDKRAVAQGDDAARNIVQFAPQSDLEAKDQHGFGRKQFVNPTITRLLDGMESKRGVTGPSELV